MALDHTNTPDEIIDLVDVNDRIIGQTTKGEANKNPNLIHREVAIFLMDEKKRLLFHQRSPKKTVRPLYWICSVAGHVPRKMDPTKAAHKELVEELGFDTDLTYLDKELYHYEEESHFCYWFYGRYRNESLVPDPAEINKIAFLTEKELENRLAEGLQFNPNYIRMAKKIWTGNLRLPTGSENLTMVR